MYFSYIQFLSHLTTQFSYDNKYISQECKSSIRKLIYIIYFLYTIIFPSAFTCHLFLHQPDLKFIRGILAPFAAKVSMNGRRQQQIKKLK